VQLNEYRLWIKNKLHRWHELRPLNIPEPNFEIFDGQLKLIPVLGQVTQHFSGDTLVAPGCMISGMLCYVYEVCGGAGWDPAVGKNNSISTKFKIRSVFGKVLSCRIRAVKKSLDFIDKIVPGMLPAKTSEQRQPS